MEARAWYVFKGEAEYSHRVRQGTQSKGALVADTGNGHAHVDVDIFAGLRGSTFPFFCKPLGIFKGKFL